MITCVYIHPLHSLIETGISITVTPLDHYVCRNTNCSNKDY